MLPITLDLPTLQTNHTRLYYFGLGFIQLKIDEQYRVHFYSPKIPPIVDDIHNHRYDFESTILMGTLTNTLWGVKEGDTHIRRSESCNPDIKSEKIEKKCAVEFISKTIYTAGQTYKMSESEFHQVSANNCITFLKRGPMLKKCADIIAPKDTQPVCPFSRRVQEENLWVIIKEMLAQLNNKVDLPLSCG